MVTEVTWATSDKDGFIYNPLGADSLYCCKYQKTRKLIPDFKKEGGGWTFLLFLADYGWTSSQAARRVASFLHPKSYGYGPDADYTFHLVMAGRPGVGVRERLSPIFSCDPKQDGMTRPSGNLRSSRVRGGCFDSLYELDSLWAESNYKTLNSWLHTMRINYQKNPENHIASPAAGFPLFMAVDDKGIVRIVMDAHRADAVGAVLVDYFGKQEKVLAGGWSNEGPMLGGIWARRCNAHAWCIFDPKKNEWRHYGEGRRPVLGQQSALNGPDELESKFIKMGEIHKEMTSIPGKVLQHANRE